MKSKVAVILFSFAWCAVCSATEGPIYVDDAWFGKGGNGTEQAPYGTIQDAVNAAASGDTILVLPGTYDKGYSVIEGFTNRVAIGFSENGGYKALTIRSTGGRAVTTIVGAYDPDQTNGSGAGPAAIRPVRIQTSAGKPVILEGFTITGGSCHEPTSANTHNYGGAVLGNWADLTWLVDCEITANGGNRGITYKVSLLRCYVHDIHVPSAKGMCSWLGTVVNSVVSRVSGGNPFCSAKVYNSTLDNVWNGQVATETSWLYNSVLMRQSANFSDSGSNHVFNCVCNSKEYHFWAGSSGNVTEARVEQLVAPILDDYRLVNTSDAIGLGDPSHLEQVAVPEGYDVWTDFHGQPIPKTGRINAGAVQEVVTPAGGRMTFTASVGVVGCPSLGFKGMANDYAYAVEYPVQWHLKPNLDPEKGEVFYGYQYDNKFIRYPQMDETFWVMPPPAGQFSTNQVRVAAHVYYVDPVNGRDEPVADEERGTEENPFRTLQKVADVTPFGLTDRTVAICAAGDYAEGGAWDGSVSNRVFMTTSKNAQYIRFKGAGAGLSTIHGQLDLTSEGHSEDGLGPAAMRCVRFDQGCFQGFTLTEGRSRETNDNKEWDHGGAVFCGNTDGTIADCVITNCAATRGGATWNARLYHCRISGIVLGAVRYAKCFACIADHNPINKADTAALTSGCDVWHCTAVGDSTSRGGINANSDMNVYNTIGCVGASLGGYLSTLWHGSIVWGFTSYGGTDGVGHVRADPLFRDVANGDYRVLSCSPALTCGEFYDGYWADYTTDYYGKPILFVDGKPLAGAVQAIMPGVFVSSAQDYGITSATNGVAVDPGESVTVTASDSLRPVAGLEVDGTYFPGLRSYTYTAPALADLRPCGTFVKAVYPTDLYVNPDPTVGSDDNDGFSPETPLLTFTNAMAKVFEGDTVHAAPGVYNEGAEVTPETASGAANRARVYVRTPNIRIVADEGQDVTVIEGAPSPEPTNSYGMGPGATRCVYVTRGLSGVVVDGFTFRGGRTLASGNDPGGAVWCSNVNPCFKNCFFTNNIAYFAGAANNGSLIGCKLIDNRCTKNRAATSGSDLYNCFFDYNLGTVDQGTAYNVSYAAINCTFGPHNKVSGKNTVIAAFGSPNNKAKIANNVVCCVGFARVGQQSEGFLAPRPENCAFSDENDLVYPAERIAAVTNNDACITVSADCVDAEGRPVWGSPIIDAGTNGVLVTYADRLAVDKDGGQRVYNGTIDMGCYEYDWRAKYAETLGEGVTVTNAAPDVKLADGVVRLADGAAIAGTWAKGTPTRKSRYTVTETASDGTLEGAFAADGTVVSERALTDATQTETFTAKCAALDWAYSFTASGEDGCGEIGPFDYAPPPGALLIVR